MFGKPVNSINLENFYLINPKQKRSELILTKKFIKHLSSPSIINDKEKTYFIIYDINKCIFDYSLDELNKELENLQDDLYFESKRQDAVRVKVTHLEHMIKAIDFVKQIYNASDEVKLKAIAELKEAYKCHEQNLKKLIGQNALEVIHFEDLVKSKNYSQYNCFPYSNYESCFSKKEVEYFRSYRPFVVLNRFNPDVLKYLTDILIFIIESGKKHKQLSILESEEVRDAYKFFAQYLLLLLIVDQYCSNYLYLEYCRNKNLELLNHNEAMKENEEILLNFLNNDLKLMDSVLEDFEYSHIKNYSFEHYETGTLDLYFTNKNKLVDKFPDINKIFDNLEEALTKKVPPIFYAKEEKYVENDINLFFDINQENILNHITNIQKKILEEKNSKYNNHLFNGNYKIKNNEFINHVYEPNNEKRPESKPLNKINNQFTKYEGTLERTLEGTKSDGTLKSNVTLDGTLEKNNNISRQELLQENLNLTKANQNKIRPEIYTDIISRRDEIYKPKNFRNTIDEFLRSNSLVV